MATPKSVDRIQELLALHEAKKKDLIGLGLSEEEKVAVRDSKKELKGLAQETLFLDRFEATMKKVLSMPRQDFSKYNPPKLKPNKEGRVLTAIWSDLHFGANLKKGEVITPYGPVEEARRMSKIVTEIADYKPQYRDHTTLRINLIGDIIEGNMHDPRFAQDHDVQIGAAFHILSQSIDFLAHQFASVEVECQVGNHGRRTERHKQRALQGKADSYEGGLYQTLRCYFAKYPNVKINFPRTPYSTYKVFGHHCFTSHGDTVMNPGNPNQEIKVAALNAKVDRWNSAPNMPKFSMFSVGHVHFPAVFRLPNGAWFITNGALIPPGNYGESNDHPSSSCGQWIIESTAEHVGGDMRFLVVDSGTDADKTLDNPIKRFTWQGE
jgi:hypothetical protein